MEPPTVRRRKERCESPLPPAVKTWSRDSSVFARGSQPSQATDNRIENFHVTPSDEQLASFQQALEANLDGEVRFDKISRALYSTDASVYQIMPLGVVIPRTRDDVLKTVQKCREFGVSITARGV